MQYQQTAVEVFQHMAAKHPELTAGVPVSLIDQTKTILFGDFQSHELGRALHSAYTSAMALDHRLPDWLVTMQGMSGRKYRYLINNLVRNVADAVYLEVGSWAGSTACSAIWDNSVLATCIDDWSQFGGPRDQFIANVTRSVNERVEFRYIELDFRKIDYSKLGKPANIYLFDGPHEEQDQYDGVAIALPALADAFVLIVDDFNWEAVRNGTHRAIADNGLSIACSIEIRTTTDGSHPKVARQNSDWHNGYFIAVLHKPS